MGLTEKRKQENRKRLNELLNRYPAEPEESDLETINEFYNNIKYTDEEIEFMAKCDFDAFSNKFPSLCEYFMEVLD